MVKIQPLKVKHPCRVKMALPLSGLYQAQAAGTRYVFLKGPWPGVVDTDDQLSVSPTYDVMLGTWPLVTPG